MMPLLHKLRTALLGLGRPFRARRVVQRLQRQVRLLDELRSAAPDAEARLVRLAELRRDLKKQRLNLELKTTLDQRWREDQGTIDFTTSSSGNNARAIR